MRAAGVRVLGAAVLAGAGPAAWALARRTDPLNGSTGTIYPWWAWALVVAAGACGLVALVVPRSRWTAVAAATGIVVGAQLAGTGVVAVRHWRPAIGMGVPGGDFGQLSTLVPLAALLALSGAVVACAGSLVLLAQRGEPGTGLPSRTRVLLLALSVVTALVVPVLAVGAHLDITSWGAAGLISAGPWAAALALAAVSPARVARALTAAVAGSAALVAVGPHMAHLSIDSRVAWTTGLVIALVAAAATVLGPTSGTSCAPAASR